MLPLFYRCLGEKFVKSNVIAIIPAREYDANLHNKNTLPFGRNNLLRHKIEQLKKVSLYVKPDRISIPAVGGVCRPEQHLLGKRPEVFRNLVNHVAPSGPSLPSKTRACQKISYIEELKLVRVLFKAKNSDVYSHSHVTKRCVRESAQRMPARS